MTHRMGKLFNRNFGNLRLNRGDRKTQFEVKQIEYQPQKRQISLDVAIKQNQERIAKEKEAKRQRREQQIQTAKRIGGNFIRALQESDNPPRRRKSKTRKRRRS